MYLNSAPSFGLLQVFPEETFSDVGGWVGGSAGLRALSNARSSAHVDLTAPHRHQATASPLPRGAAVVHLHVYRYVRKAADPPVSISWLENFRFLRLRMREPLPVEQETPSYFDPDLHKCVSAHGGERVRGCEGAE